VRYWYQTGTNSAEVDVHERLEHLSVGRRCIGLSGLGAATAHRAPTSPPVSYDRPMAASTWSAAAIVAVATVVVSIANLIFLWINARATRHFEERSQRTARTQARLEDTYSNFVTLMHRQYVWAESVVTLSPVPPDSISDREVSEAIGQLRTFGSDAAVRAADSWADAFHDAVEAIVHSTGDARRRIDEMRTRENVFRDIIREDLEA
jgi:hypothetical protein